MLFVSAPRRKKDMVLNIDDNMRKQDYKSDQCMPGLYLDSYFWQSS